MPHGCFFAMAFVSLGVSTLRGRALNADDNVCDISAAKRGGPPNSRTARMAFSSIDMPEKASVLFDETVEAKEAVVTRHINMYLETPMSWKPSEPSWPRRKVTSKVTH